ncbi:hypothetical protein ACTQ33_03810 [Candidatus Avoscillospira sp. LCP25S3_F1]|uniref:hypothetical protein n=1 Tax=Candidatus Avoscillospira sp. LCP25S3_F1 TaxID=3438825 RepID=UPI003F8F6917
MNAEDTMPHKDILDRLITQILKEEVISPEEWECRMDELSEEPDVVPTKSEIETAEAAWMAFQAHLNRLGLPADHRFQLCKTLYTKALTEPTIELTQLYCNIVCNSSVLLDSKCNVEQMAACWHSQCKQTDALYQYLMQRKQTSICFQQILRNR